MNSRLEVKTIEKMLRDEDCDVRQAALETCKGRADVPLSIIELGLRDVDWCVRQAALEVCKINGIEIPLIRTFEPPEKVYKKCLGGVIVEAHIPDDAQVRGRIGSKCRADKAIITDIIGEFFGQKIGISNYVRKTEYVVGDVVEIDDFGYSDKECSAGFHFFCSIQEAMDYIL